MFLVLVLLLVSFTAALSEKTCDETVAKEIRTNLIRDSLKQVKVSFPKCRDADEDIATCGKSSTALAFLDLVLDILDGTQIEGGKIKECPKCPDPVVIEGDNGPMDCLDILKMGYKTSGVYTIYPKHLEKGTQVVKVYCDMDTDGGGWTVLQRRGNFSTQTNFFRKWDEYKKGFGFLERDFWLGNENIFTISNQAVYSLRIDGKRVDGEFRYGQYDIFFITDEDSDYSLFAKEFTGNDTDGLYSQHLRKFSTSDRPNEGMHGSEVCAYRNHGAWWYPPTNSCGHMNLNGLYMPGIDNLTSNWNYRWIGYRGLLTSEMKIRRRNFKAVKQ